MANSFARMIQTIDSHTEGNSTRVIVGGVPVPPGNTLLERREALWRRDDGLRRMLNFEPRGHGMMCSVLLMPPIGDADFSIIIMEQDEYVPMCGHCLIGVATTIVATGMKAAVEPATRLRIETPAGLVEAEVEVAGGRVGAVSFVNVELFVLYDRVPVEVPDYGRLTVSIAYGGDFYCFVDADAIGVELAPHCEPQMLAVAQKVIPAVNEQLSIRHPKRPDINRCYQTLLTSAATTVGDYRQAIMCPPGLPRSLALRHRHQRQGGPAPHARRVGIRRRAAVRRPAGHLLLGRGCDVGRTGRDPLRAPARVGSSLSDRLSPIRPGAGRSLASGLSHRPQASRRAGADGVRGPA